MDIDINEFLKSSNDSVTETNNAENTDKQPDEIDVQKAVVESLAADKAEQDEIINSLHLEKNSLSDEITTLRQKLAIAQKSLNEVGEILARNSENQLSNQLSLIDRNAEIADRFTGETRDHVLEVLKEARDKAEKNGRIRCAQILESILVANEPNGELKKQRENLKKLFADNANIINGKVIEELDKLGISYKNGEEYLLPSEIINRYY